MKESFTDYQLNNKSLMVLNLAKSVIKGFHKLGYALTLRQLFYQLVSMGEIPNSLNEYRKLGRILTKGRMMGEIDWDSIEDRTRIPRIPYFVRDPDHAIEDTISQYRLDRQLNQDFYLEVWSEKDALSDILYRVTSHYHVYLQIVRGFDSTSSIYKGSKRFLKHKKNDQDPILLYVGDHDPSGLEMIRDIRERLEILGIDIEIDHVALTMDQIKKYNPPPNLTKKADSRSPKYIEEFGNTSWEVDALHPEDLKKILIDKIENWIDVVEFEGMIEQEEEDKEELRKLIK